MKSLRASWVALVLLVAVGAMAQTGTSRLTGVVTDPSGAVVAGASVTLINELTKISYKTVSTDAGTYLFDAIPPATYTVQVELAGFKTIRSTDNVVTVGVPATVHARLEVGQATTVIEVAATYERVQTSTSGNFGTTIDNRTLVELPIGLESGTGGRNPLRFVLLQPGVNQGANTGGSSHVNGARDRAFNYTLDGIDINETSAGGSEFTPLRTNPDSLQEFRVITSNATAQYGRNSGAQVELVTKSGTNQLHGNVFYYHRNSALAANEWENNFNGVRRAQLLQHLWGSSVGGPIFRDRTFFFFNYEQQRAVNPFTITRTVYTQLARQGIFRYVVGDRNRPAGQAGASVDASGNPLLPSCGGSVTTNCIAAFNIPGSDPRGLGLDPTIANEWIGLTPLPNLFNTGDGLNTAGYIFSGGRTDPQRNFVVRIDHSFNAENKLYGRYAWGRQDTVNDTTNSGAPRFPGLPPIVNTERKPNNLALGYTRVVSPTMVNELVVGSSHFLFDFVTPTAGSVLPFFLNNVTDPLLVSRGNLRKLTTYQLVDNFSWNLKAHALRMGINFRYQQHIDVRGSVAGVNSEREVTFNQTVNTACAGGSFGTGGTPGISSTGQELFCLPSTSSSTPLFINTNDRPRLQNTINDLLGRIGRVQQGFVAKDDLQSFEPGGTTFRNDARYGEYDFYFQDTWKWKPNFTIDLGVRLELKGHPTNPRNRILVPDEPVFAGAPPSTTLQWVRGPLYDNDYNNWSPSIGFAWDPFKSGKTSVRANYRLAYDRINTFLISSQIFNNLPGLSTSVINTAFGQNGGPGGTGGRWRDANQPVLTPTVTPEQLTQPPAFGVGAITVMDRNFRAPKTNMWQLDIQRELWKGIVVDVAYIGRRATGLFGAYDVNQVDIFDNGFLDEFLIVQQGGQSALINQLYGPDTRRQSGETGSDFVRRQFATSVGRNAVAAIAEDAASRIQSGVPLLTLAGLPTTFFRTFPQFATLRVIDANDYSTYHALQVVTTRKFARGVTFQAAYTWSKSLDTRSFDPAFTVVSTGAAQSASSTPFNIYDRRLNYALSDFDRPHIFVGYWIWDLPFGRGQRFGAGAPAWVQRLIEGWRIAGDMTWESGRPFTVFSGANQLSNVVNSTANCTLPSGSRCPREMGEVNLRDPNFANVPSYFSATEIGYFSQPGAGEVGNTGRNYFRRDQFFVMNSAFSKRTNISEQVNFELRFDFFNLTNSVFFLQPTATITSTSFGRIGDSTGSSSRKVRVGAKINF